jgi:hypothetical protein
MNHTISWHESYEYGRKGRNTILAYLEFFQGNEDKCSWSARFLFDRQKVMIADHHDREHW